MRSLYFLRQLLHAVSGTMILIFTIIAVIYADGKAIVEKTNYMEHKLTGTFVEIGVYSLVGVGFALKASMYAIVWIKKEEFWNLLWLVKYLHGLAGKAIILLSMWTMFTGLFSYNSRYDKYKQLLIASYVVYLLALLILEIRF